MSQQLASEVLKAAHLLESLTRHSPPEKPLGELNPKCLRDCKVRLAELYLDRLEDIFAC